LPKGEMDPENPPVLLLDQSGKVIRLEWEAKDVGQGKLKLFGQTIELQLGKPLGPGLQALRSYSRDSHKKRKARPGRGGRPGWPLGRRPGGFWRDRLPLFRLKRPTARGPISYLLGEVLEWRVVGDGVRAGDEAVVPVGVW
jgi:hypothetical protein